MTVLLVRSLIFAAFGLFLLVIPRGGMASVPTNQEELREWWDGAGRLWMGDSGYVVTGRDFEDGFAVLGSRRGSSYRSTVANRPSLNAL